MSFRSEFTEFIAKGNVIDLAVGVVIGAAFSKIVTSLVEDVLMPPLGMVTQGVDFTQQKIILKQAIMEGGKEIPAVTLNYGNFIQNIFQFLIVALAIFIFVVKPINRLKRKKATTAEAAAPTAPSEEVVLLTEIRDALKRP